MRDAAHRVAGFHPADAAARHIFVVEAAVPFVSRNAEEFGDRRFPDRLGRRYADQRVEQIEQDGVRQRFGQSSKPMMAAAHASPADEIMIWRTDDTND